MKIEKTDEGTSNQMVRVKGIQGDMGEDTQLHFIQQPDGDVIIVLSNTEKHTRDSIEFCSVSGGGHYPWFTQKLREIIAEFEKREGG